MLQRIGQLAGLHSRSVSDGFAAGRKLGSLLSRLDIAHHAAAAEVNTTGAQPGCSSNDSCRGFSTALISSAQCCMAGQRLAAPGLSAAIVASSLRDFRHTEGAQMASAIQQCSLHESVAAGAPEKQEGDVQQLAEADQQQAGRPAQAQQPRSSKLPRLPWTPTRLLDKRKTLPKRMGHMLQLLEEEKVAEALKERSIPAFGPGSVLEVKLAIPQNRRRVAVMKGLCIARRNRGLRTSFTIRNFLGTAGGIERTFPLFSPHIESIKVLSTRKVRRAKLYYLRDRQAKEFRVA